MMRSSRSRERQHGIGTIAGKDDESGRAVDDRVARTGREAPEEHRLLRRPFVRRATP